MAFAGPNRQPYVSATHEIRLAPRRLVSAPGRMVAGSAEVIPSEQSTRCHSGRAQRVEESHPGWLTEIPRCTGNDREGVVIPSERSESRNLSPRPSSW